MQAGIYLPSPPDIHLVFGVQGKLPHLDPLVGIGDGIVQPRFSLALLTENTALLGNEIMLQQGGSKTNRVMVVVRVIKIEAVTKIFDARFVDRVKELKRVYLLLARVSVISRGIGLPGFTGKRDIRPVAVVNQRGVRE